MFLHGVPAERLNHVLAPRLGHKSILRLRHDLDEIDGGEEALRWICEHNGVRWDWSNWDLRQRERLVEKLWELVERGVFVVLHKFQEAVLPAFHQADGRWEPSDTRSLNPDAYRRFAIYLEQRTHEEHERKEWQSRNQPPTPEVIESAVGPGYRKPTLGPQEGEIQDNATGSSDPIAQRRVDNERLKQSPRYEADRAKASVTEQDIELMNAKEKPLGFKSKEQFGQFKQELDVAMSKAGLSDAEVRLKGTSTTFYSENPGKPVGHHWDADPANPGDYDLNITSGAMVKKLQDAGIKPKEKYGVFRTRDINKNFPHIDEFREKWSATLGRKVNFVGYPKPAPRDATEYVLRGVK